MTECTTSLDVLYYITGESTGAAAGVIFIIIEKFNLYKKNIFLLWRNNPALQILQCPLSM